jgi:hypothetical protein
MPSVLPPPGVDMPASAERLTQSSSQNSSYCCKHSIMPSVLPPPGVDMPASAERLTQSSTEYPERLCVLS